MSSRSIRFFSSMNTIAAACTILVLCFSLSLPVGNAQTPAPSERFFPLTQGTYWLYHGTVSWTDPDTQKIATNEVSFKMSIEKIIQKPEFTIAVLAGYPADLDWANGEVEPKPWLLIETAAHQVYLDPLPPDFDFSKLQQDAASLSKLLADDNLLFRWPLKPGLKFGDPESLLRSDNQYSWVVLSQEKKNLSKTKGLPGHPVEVFLLRYSTNPDDTELELSPGLGILSYQYHHHGTVADTSMTLVEFHPGTISPAPTGAKP